MFFIGWTESRRCFLLTLADGSLEFVPKHLFSSSEDINTFRALMARNIELRSFYRPRGRPAKPADTTDWTGYPVPGLPSIHGTYTRWYMICATFRCLNMSPVAVLLFVMVFGPIGWFGAMTGVVGAVLAFWVPTVFGVVWGFFVQPRRWVLSRMGVGKDVWSGVTTIHLQPAGLLFETQAASRSYVWEDFKCWREDGVCFVLILPDGGYEFIPMRFFSRWQDRKVFRDFLRARFKGLSRGGKAAQESAARIAG